MQHDDENEEWGQSHAHRTNDDEMEGVAKRLVLTVVDMMSSVDKSA